MSLVSVIIPVHKTIDFFKKCVFSVLEQSYHNFEIILACNGDLEVEKCKAFLETNDERLIYIKTKNGRHNARNEALNIAKGKYIQYLDYDDVLFKEKIETQVVLLEKYSESKMFSICKWKKFKENVNENYTFPYDNVFDENRIDAKKLIKKLSLNGGFIATASWLIPKNLIADLQWIDSPNDDAVFLSGVLNKNPEIEMVPEINAGYRIHDHNTSSVLKKTELNKLLLSWRIIYKNFYSLQVFETNLYIYKAYLNLITYSKILKGYKILSIIYKTIIFGFRAKLKLKIVGYDIKKMLFK